ncbi:MAG: twin-arginine translocase TatA/TatE family subunit [Sphingomonadales bacterium]|nr:twin-arginine translocase TatA/TatE family subunit [Sphingomonadales bacterium]
MGLSFSHILLVLILVVLLFGRGKISELMGDVAKGVKAFKKGLSEDEEKSPAAEPKALRDDGNKAAGTEQDRNKSA